MKARIITTADLWAIMIIGWMLVAGLAFLSYRSCRHVPATPPRMVPAERPQDRYAVEFTPLLHRAAYDCLFDGRTRTAACSVEYLDAKTLAGTAARFPFAIDPDVPPEFRPEPADYLNSGFDRGHVANHADAESSDEASRQTFLMSNMMPQAPELNRIAWAALEKYVRSIASQPDTAVWVATGPAWIPDADGVLTVKAIGPNRVWVPSHCWKSILIERAGQRHLESWLYKNAPGVQDRDSCRASVDEIEAAAGLDLWRQLPEPEQSRLEAVR